MTGFDSLADITIGDILGNFSFHTSPLEVLFQILVYFHTARVHREFGYVGFIQYLFTELMVLRYNDKFIEP
jgi:hypothetical protein